MAWIKQHKHAVLWGAAGLLSAFVIPFVFGVLQVGLNDRKSPPDQQKGRPLSAQLSADSRLTKADVNLQRPLFLRLFKDESLLEMWRKEKGQWHLLKTYEICRWAGKLGPKQREGDHQSPEGFYLVGKRQLNPNSSYHLSFNLGFPNAVEQAQGRTGSYLMVHGGCQSAGCYAMTDEGVEEIYRMVEAALSGGQEAVPVHVFPFRLSAKTLSHYATDERHGFWQGLQPAYQSFEDKREPPVIYGCGADYSLEPAAGCHPLKPW